MAAAGAAPAPERGARGLASPLPARADRCARRYGKSELLAALGLWLLLDDAGPAPQIACAGASDREAAVAFGAARTMCELSPTLRALTERWERVIEVPLRQGARLLRVAGGAPADAEARYSAVLLDDLQRWTLPRQVAGHAALASGPPGGPEPLLIQMASAGRERETPCYREYAYGRALREGAVDDRGFFFAWFEAPEGLDPASEQAWRAANPSAGVTVGFEDYREQLGRAPESELRRAHLNQWVELEAPWLPRGAWAACRGDERLQEGALTFVAIDASTKVDSTAVAVLQPQGELEVVRCRLWERPPEPCGRRGGERWQLPIEELKAHVRALCERFAVRAIGYDPAFVTWTAEELLAEGLPMIRDPADARADGPGLTGAVRAHRGAAAAARRRSGARPARPRGGGGAGAGRRLAAGEGTGAAADRWRDRPRDVRAASGGGAARAAAAAWGRLSFGPGCCLDRGYASGPRPELGGAPLDPRGASIRRVLTAFALGDRGSSWMPASASGSTTRAASPRSHWRIESPTSAPRQPWSSAISGGEERSPSIHQRTTASISLRGPTKRGATAASRARARTRPCRAAAQTSPAGESGAREGSRSGGCSAPSWMASISAAPWRRMTPPSDAAHAAQAVVAGGCGPRELEQGTVVEDARGGAVAALRLVLAPGGKGAERALGAAAEAGPTLDAAEALVRWRPPPGGGGEQLALFDDPVQPLALVEPGSQLGPDPPEVADVVQRVRELLVGERAAQPFGVLRALAQAHADHVLHERGIADLVAEAHEGGGDLGVADRGAADLVVAGQQCEVGLGGVGDGLDPLVADELGDRADVHLERVERGKLRPLLVAPRDLHEAELRNVAALGDELEVEYEAAGGADAGGDRVDLLWHGGERAVHPVAIPHPRVRGGAAAHGSASHGARTWSCAALVFPPLTEGKRAMRAGTNLRESSRELAVALDGEELPGGGWQPLTSRTDLGIVALRRLLVERGLASAGAARGHYWRMPPSAARETALLGRDVSEPRAS